MKIWWYCLLQILVTLVEQMRMYLAFICSTILIPNVIDHFIKSPLFDLAYIICLKYVNIWFVYCFIYFLLKLFTSWSFAHIAVLYNVKTVSYFTFQGSVKAHSKVIYFILNTIVVALAVSKFRLKKSCNAIQIW